MIVLVLVSCVLCVCQLSLCIHVSGVVFLCRVCLLAVCLLVLVLYVCLYLHHPQVQVTPTQQLASIAMYFGLCQKKTKQKQELMVCTALYSSAQHANCEELANVQSLLANVHMSLWLVALPSHLLVCACSSSCYLHS